MEFDKLAHDTMLTEHLNNSQGHVCGCDTGSQTTGQFETDDFRQ